MTSTDSATMAGQYRLAKPITEEMKMHCHIYLDEHLYSSAITLMSDIVTAGVSHPDFLDRPVTAPLPFHIELVSALLIHPSYTTRSSLNQVPDLASRAIAFLRNLLGILGPLNANLKEAFSFQPINGGRPSRRSRHMVHNDDGSSNSDSDDKAERMKGIIANKGRIRYCAKDFWHIVGWAFNCSVKYPKRWKYWKVWLEYMLDVLDADWSERERLQKLGKQESDIRCEAIVAMYLSDVKGRSSAARRVVKSLFADGGVDSLRDFPEVFPNEARNIRSPSGQKRKRNDPRNSDIDYVFCDDIEAGNNFPGAMDEMSDTMEATRDETSVLDSWLGGTDSLSLRQRVLALLSRTAFYTPDSFIFFGDLYEIVYDYVKPLPLPAFSSLLSTSKASELSEVVSISLGQVLLARFLPDIAPRPSDISGDFDDALSQEKLEKCFLPFSAMTSSVTDNAKVSILVEGLFRLYLRNCPCNITESLRVAIEQGILARQAKIKDKRRKKEASKKRQQDELWLTHSSQRLRSLFTWVERMGEDGDV